MVRRRQNCAAVAGILILSGVVHAGMMPASPALVDTGDACVRASTSQVFGRAGTDKLEVSNNEYGDHPLAILRETPCGITTSAGLSGPSDWSTLTGDLHSRPALPFHDSQNTIEPSDETQSVRTLADEQSSLSLAVYALISLGLLRSGGLVKKLSFRVIPDWYHEGGPFQVGHSLAISPDCLCPAPVHCFVQPDDVADDLGPPYGWGTLSPLLRESLFTPTVLGPRPPPSRS